MRPAASPPRGDFIEDDRRSAVSATRLAALLLLGLAVAACSTATPIVVNAPKLAPLGGRANTTAGYTGEITTDGRKCRGTFTGAPGEPIAPLEMSCADGRRGLGQAVIADRRFVSGAVRLNDGSRLTIRASGPSYP